MLKSTLRLISCLAGLSLALCSMAQEANYILQQQSYNPGLSSLNFSPDGKLLLAGFADGSFRVLDPESLKVSLEVKEAHQKAVVAMDMPPDMDFIMSAGGKMIRVWNSETGKHIGNFSGHATTIWNAEISRDGKHAVSSAFNKTFLLWDVYNGVVKTHMRGHKDVTRAVSLSPDNLTMASGSDDLSIRLWDMESSELKQELHGPTGAIYHLCFSPDNRLLAASSAEYNIRIYDLENASLLLILNGHEKVVRKSVFSPDSRYLASISEDRCLKLWDLVRDELVHTFADHSSILLDVDFHPSGKSLYTVDAEGSLIQRELHPELFVLRYFGDSYREEINAEALFEDRLKGESKKDYQLRRKEADKRRTAIIESYYKRYQDEILGTAPVQ